MRRMRIVLIVVLALLSPMLLFAASKYEMDNVSQMVLGYIGVETQLYLELDDTYYDSENGINLDINDSGNSAKFLIAPSPGELGLRIGHFTFIAQAGTSGTITISHTPLVTPNSDSLDYELGISYSVSNQAPVQAFCDSSTNGGLDGNKIDINLSDWVNTIYIKDGGIHFRLITPVETEGDYTSTITFVFTSDTGQGS
ncbi:MAG: hypothetical protein ILP16_05435 [Spirochaetales bacterium]|nr:hypothetical protein [Spirochaetales bacterium]